MGNGTAALIGALAGLIAGLATTWAMAATADWPLPNDWKPGQGGR